MRVIFASVVLLFLSAEPATQWKAFRSRHRLLHHYAASCLNPAAPLISVPGPVKSARVHTAAVGVRAFN